MSPLDLKGIHQFTEDDDETTFSELLNLLAGSVSDALAWFAGTAAERDALQPAPPGGMWQDTDGDKRLWSCGPDGFWRLHEGRASIPASAFAGAAPLYFRSQEIVLPTVLAADETLILSQDSNPEMGVIGVSAITRNPASTGVQIRHIQLGNTNQKVVTCAWRIVKGAS
jgi:hypothetical protein